MSATDQKKILAIFGATGYQGGSVLNYFASLPSSPYAIRALTRDPNSPKAQALLKTYPHISVQKADLGERETLLPVLEDANVVFLVTDWVAAGSPAAETQQAKNVVDILAKSSSIEHFIWSALPSVAAASSGKYPNVKHFESKAEVTRYTEKTYPDLWKKTTEVWLTGYYQIWRQFPGLFAPSLLGDGSYGLKLPLPETQPFPTNDVRDSGLVIDAILAKGSELGGRTVSVVGDGQTSYSEKVKVWGNILGKKTTYEYISDEEFSGIVRGFGFPEPLIPGMIEVFAAAREFPQVYVDNSVFASDILLEGKRLRTWKEFVKDENWDFILEQS